MNRTDAAFKFGYKKGRVAGFERGRAAGKIKGYQDTLSVVSSAALPQVSLGSALVIVPAVHLPSLEILVCQPLNRLKAAGTYDYIVKTEESVKKEDIAAASIVVFLRLVEPGSLKFLNWANELGKKTVYIIDDNFLEIPSKTDLFKYYHDQGRRDTFVTFLRNSQLIQVASSYFADYIRIYFNPRVAYFPASVDFGWIEQAPRQVRNDGKIVIGYEGTSKEEDFAPVIPAIKRILKEYAGTVSMEFHGYIPEELRFHPQIAHFSQTVDYRSFIQQLYQNTWDIGLAPLSDSVFNFCKTNNKFREYGACWITGIYSDTPAYQESVIQGETGLLVPHTSEGWYNGLKELIDNADLRIKIRDQAGGFVRQHYQIETAAENWLNHILRV